MSKKELEVCTFAEDKFKKINDQDRQQLMKWVQTVFRHLRHKRCEHCLVKWYAVIDYYNHNNLAGDVLDRLGILLKELVISNSKPFNVISFISKGGHAERLLDLKQV